MKTRTADDLPASRVSLFVAGALMVKHSAITKRDCDVMTSALGAFEVDTLSLGQSSYCHHVFRVFPDFDYRVARSGPFFDRAITPLWRLFLFELILGLVAKQLSFKVS